MRNRLVAWVLIALLGGVFVACGGSDGEGDGGGGTASGGDVGEGGSVGQGGFVGEGGTIGEGGSDGEGGSGDGPRYLVYGVVWDTATDDCPEGSHMFDDAQAYYTQIVEGTWADTYKAASDAMKAKMQADYPGASSHFVESSWVTAGKDASHAVFIQYSRRISGWDCRPIIIQVGIGKSYDEALDRALKKKDENGGQDKPYEELDRLTW